MDARPRPPPARGGRKAHAGRPVDGHLRPARRISRSTLTTTTAKLPTGGPIRRTLAARIIRKDGQTNPNRFNANKAALNAMCDAVFTLGTAAFLLDDPRYAQRAARVHPHLVPQPQDAHESRPGIRPGRARRQPGPRLRHPGRPRLHPRHSGHGISGPDRRLGCQGPGGRPEVVRGLPALAGPQQKRREEEKQRQQPRVLVDRAGGRRRQFRGERAATSRWPSISTATASSRGRSASNGSAPQRGSAHPLALAIPPSTWKPSP